MFYYLKHIINMITFLYIFGQILKSLIPGCALILGITSGFPKSQVYITDKKNTNVYDAHSIIRLNIF